MFHPYNGRYGTVEFLEEDTSQVMLYPANASVTVYPWRSFWRKKEAPHGAQD